MVSEASRPEYYEGFQDWTVSFNHYSGRARWMKNIVNLIYRIEKYTNIKPDFYLLIGIFNIHVHFNLRSLYSKLTQHSLSLSSRSFREEINSDVKKEMAQNKRERYSGI